MGTQEALIPSKVLTLTQLHRTLCTAANMNYFGNEFLSESRRHISVWKPWPEGPSDLGAGITPSPEGISLAGPLGPPETVIPPDGLQSENA